MSRRTQGSPRRLDHVDRQSQVGVSGAMRARDVSRPTDDDDAAAAEAAAEAAADAVADSGDDDRPAMQQGHG